MHTDGCYHIETLCVILVRRKQTLKKYKTIMKKIISYYYMEESATIHYSVSSVMKVLTLCIHNSVFVEYLKLLKTEAFASELLDNFSEKV